jgi:hypothetical protein
VTIAGNGSGTVECKVGSGPFGSCTGPIAQGSQVSVRASASLHSAFAGFSAATGSAAACSSSPCTFTLEANSALTATFAKVFHTLALSASGDGAGTVTCNGAPCAASYEEGTVVNLAASPAAGSTFSGWSGACAGAGPCSLTLNANAAVGAGFAKEAPPPTQGTPQAPRQASYAAGKVSLKIACKGPGQCQGAFTLAAKLAAKKKTIAKGSFDIAAGKSKTVKVKVTNRQAKKLLGAGKALKASYGGALEGTVKIKPAKGRRA